jgi:hypothetical protein
VGLKSLGRSLLALTLQIGESSRFKTNNPFLTGAEATNLSFLEIIELLFSLANE